MWRKRKNPSPAFRMPPPMNPFTGQHAGLPGEPDLSRVAIFQVIETDIYDDYLVCRGYDTEVKRFFKSMYVAKPYDRRGLQDYEVGNLLICGVALTRLGQNPGKAETTVGNPADLNENIVLLYVGDTPIRWIHLGTKLAFRAVELKETLWPNGSNPKESGSLMYSSGDPEEDRTDNADGWVVAWNPATEEYVKPDYINDPLITVHERASAYFGMGKVDAEYGERGDIVFINQDDVVVGGPYPILTARVEGNMDCGEREFVRLLDTNAKAAKTVEAWDRVKIMGPQIQPCQPTLEHRVDSTYPDKLTARWNKYSEEWEVITLGGVCTDTTSTPTPEPCRCGYVCIEGWGWSLVDDRCHGQAGTTCEPEACDSFIPDADCVADDTMESYCGVTTPPPTTSTTSHTTSSTTSHTTGSTSTIDPGECTCVYTCKSGNWLSVVENNCGCVEWCGGSASTSECLPFVLSFPCTPDTRIVLPCNAYCEATTTPDTGTTTPDTGTTTPDTGTTTPEPDCLCEYFCDPGSNDWYLVDNRCIACESGWTQCPTWVDGPCFGEVGTYHGPCEFAGTTSSTSGTGDSTGGSTGDSTGGSTGDTTGGSTDGSTPPPE